MRTQFRLEKEDFLTQQLFIASNSERIQKRRKRDWSILVIGSLVLAVYFYLQDVISMTVYFVLCGIVFAAFYGMYFKWRYKRHYANFIDDQYQNRIGEEVDIELREDSIFIKDRTGEGTVYMKEVVEINNLLEHILVSVSSGSTLIIPKRKVTNSDLILSIFKSKEIKINNCLAWKW